MKRQTGNLRYGRDHTSRTQLVPLWLALGLWESPGLGQAGPEYPVLPLGLGLQELRGGVPSTHLPTETCEEGVPSRRVDISERVW